MQLQMKYERLKNLLMFLGAEKAKNAALAVA